MPEARLRGEAEEGGGSDLELVRRFVEEGDRQAFEALARRHLPSMRRFLALSLPDPGEAADAEQEVLVRMFRSLAAYRGESGSAPGFSGSARPRPPILSGTAPGTAVDCAAMPPPCPTSIPGPRTSPLSISNGSRERGRHAGLLRPSASLMLRCSFSGMRRAFPWRNFPPSSDFVREP